MAQSEDMIPMQMAKELAQGHAADLRRLAAKPAPRLTPSWLDTKRFALAWSVLRRTAGAVHRPRLVERPTCAP